uniref:uroplakin-3b-like n=1 Tax=Euleptes europaea TaxID=460621 RepID=UPI0025414CA0|nr:uroplakin-3b-like [Euleptes europaea]
MAFATISLVLMAIGVHVDSETLTDYEPHVTLRDLEGRITASTFALEQPRCNFTDVEEDDRIWLLVARSSAAKQIDLPEDPQDLPYQNFSKKSYYMTLDTAAVNYPSATSKDEITVLRVGTETPCVNDALRPDCNGPLPDSGPYRVQFIAIRKPSNTKIPSRWSEDITLIKGRNYTFINTRPRRRSGEMIAIAFILSVLSAILLATFIAVLICKNSDIGGNAEISSIREAATVSRYTSHHVYNQPTSKS